MRPMCARWAAPPPAERNEPSSIKSAKLRLRSSDASRPVYDQVPGSARGGHPPRSGAPQSRSSPRLTYWRRCSTARAAPLAQQMLPAAWSSPCSQKLGIQLPALRAESSRALEDLPRLGESSDAEGGQPSSELTAVLREAEKQAKDLSDEYISTEHLLLALAGDQDPPTRAGQALRAVGVSRDRLLQALAEVTGPAPRDRPEPGGEVPGARALRARLHRSSPRTARSTRLSAATRRSGALSRCSRGARRTTRC